MVEALLLLRCEGEQLLPPIWISSVRRVRRLQSCVFVWI